MRLSPEVEKLLPGEEDVAFYEEHGYYVTPKMLPDDVIDEAIRGAERHWAGERDRRLPVSGGFGDWKPRDGDTIRNSEYTALQNREIRALVQHPIIGAIAARLTRSSEIRLWDDQLVSKPPSNGPRGPVVGWHTDRAYWMTCTSEEMLHRMDPPARLARRDGTGHLCRRQPPMARHGGHAESFHHCRTAATSTTATGRAPPSRCICIGRPEDRA